MQGKTRIDDLMKKAGAGEREQSVKAGGITKEFLIVALDTILLGLHIEYLREVFDLPDRNDIIPLPFVPAYILGVINVRGEIVPVLDLAGILGVTQAQDSSLKMVIIDGKFKLAFPVREIVDMKTLDIKDWRTVQDPRQKKEEQLLTQEFSYNDKTVSVIDVFRLYSSKFVI